MKRTRVPLITAVYEERLTNSPTAEAAAVAEKPHFQCDLCGKECEGAPASTGLMLWFRGDEVRIDEPPLCKDCGRSLVIGAVSKWAIEGEEEG